MYEEKGSSWRRLEGGLRGFRHGDDGACSSCLWLTSQDQRIKEAVARAFAHPFTSLTKDSVGIIPNKDTQAMKSSEGNFDSASAVELAMLRRMNQDFLKALQTDFTEKDDDSVKLEMTPDGIMHQCL